MVSSTPAAAHHRGDFRPQKTRYAHISAQVAEAYKEVANVALTACPRLLFPGIVTLPGCVDVFIRNRHRLKFLNFNIIDVNLLCSASSCSVKSGLLHGGELCSLVQSTIICAGTVETYAQLHDIVLVFVICTFGAS
jgi:hypothetical protein